MAFLPAVAAQMVCSNLPGVVQLEVVPLEMVRFEVVQLENRLAVAAQSVIPRT